MKTKFLYYTECACPMAIHPVGLKGLGVQVVIPIEDGPVEGDVINGCIKPLGADWNTIHLLGITSDVLAKYQIHTDDGAVIDLFTNGRMKVKWKDVPKNIITLKHHLSDYLYFREFLYFHTDDERYKWLETTPCFAIISMKFTLKNRVPYFLISYKAYAIEED
ncbi:MAG: DUF3237 domain-containing protein [Clostridia bacterium]|nr:DUF3237 domain-containing protein [Clostridia bacterium]